MKKAGRPNLAGDAVHELKLLSCGRSGGRGSTPTTHYSSSAYEAPTNMFQISSAARVSLRQITHMCNCDFDAQVETTAFSSHSSSFQKISFIFTLQLCFSGEALHWGTSSVTKCHSFLCYQVEEAKILWAQEQQGMAVNLVKYILQHSELEPADSAAIHCLTGKWLAETRSERSVSVVCLKDWIG